MNLGARVQCEGGPEMGIVDEYSFATAGTNFASGLFGKAAEKLSAPESVATAHGPAALLHANEGLYVAAIPMNTGSAVAWFVGRADADAELAAAAKAMVGSCTLKADRAPVHAFGAMVAHTLTYNPTHPAVLAAGALFMAILGGFGWLVLKKAPAPQAPSY